VGDRYQDIDRISIDPLEIARSLRERDTALRSRISDLRARLRYFVEIRSALERAAWRAERRRKGREAICGQRYREIPRQSAAKSSGNPRKFTSAATIRSRCPRAFHSREPAIPLLISSLLAGEERSLAFLSSSAINRKRVASRTRTRTRLRTRTRRKVGINALWPPRVKSHRHAVSFDLGGESGKKPRFTSSALTRARSRSRQSIRVSRSKTRTLDSLLPPAPSLLPDKGGGEDSREEARHGKGNPPGTAGRNIERYEGGIVRASMDRLYTLPPPPPALGGAVYSREIRLIIRLINCPASMHRAHRFRSFSI